jgi:hypothetical protein
VKKAFGNGVIPAIAFFTHTANTAMLRQQAFKTVTGILSTAA